MITRCKSCGVESRLSSAFRKAAGFWSVKRLCLRCWEKNRTSTHRLHLAIYILLGVSGLILLMLPDALVEMRVIAVFCLIPPFLIASLLPHELGHALAAKLLGLRIFSISFGLYGRTLWKRRLFGCVIEVKSLPVIGLTEVGYTSRHWVRLRDFLMVLAGPMANAALVAPIYLIFGKPSVSTGTLLLHAFVWANLLMVFLNLWPRRTSEFPSDGLQLLLTPFLSRTEIQHRCALYFWREGLSCFERHDFSDARAWAERGLRDHPGDALLLDGLAIVAIRQQRFAEAHKIFEELLARSDLDAAIRAFLLSHAAWSNLLSGEASLLDEADRFSREAAEWLPWLPDVKGARGAVLVEQNRVDEGIPLLREALKEHADAKDKAFDACYLAIGYAKISSAHEARARLEEAQKFDPHCHLLPRVFKELRHTDESRTVELPPDHVG
jgi:tetratricopeptide (TPR) repeat protein